MKKRVYQNRIFQGKTKDNWFLDFPQFLTIKDNSFYKLIIGSQANFILVFDKDKIRKLNSDFTITLPLTPISDDDGTAFNFLADWGDDSQISNITSYNSVFATHTYKKEFFEDNNEQFEIKLIGNVYGFNNKKYIDATNINAWEYLIRIQNWESLIKCYNFNYAFYEAKNLVTLPSSPLPQELITANNCFQNCISLTDLSKLNFTIHDNIESCSGMFIGCTGLTYIPKNFSINQNIKNLDSFFLNCANLKKIPDTFEFPTKLQSLTNFAANCSSLKTIPLTIWPNTGFSLQSEFSVNITSAFYNCKTASGEVPNYRLWDSNVYFNPLVAGSNITDMRPLAFSGCKNLSNYNMIPNYWRTDQIIMI